MSVDVTNRPTSGNVCRRLRVRRLQDLPSSTCVYSQDDWATRIAGEATASEAAAKKGLL